MSVTESRLGAAGRALITERAFVGCLLGTWLLTAAAHYYVMAPASVLSRVADDLAVTPAVAVWIVSAVPGTWALTNFALGVWIDRLGEYRVIVVGTAVLIAAGGWSWWAGRRGTFYPLLASRLLAGVAVGVIWTASTNLIGGAVSGANRGTAIGVYVTSAPAGFALGQLFGPIVTARAGWPANFLVMSVVAGLVIGVISLSVRRLEIDPVTNTASIRSNFTSVLSHRVVWYGSAMAFAAYSYYLFMNSWMPTYLGNEFALSAGLSGLLTAAFPAMGVLSRAGGGLIRIGSSVSVAFPCFRRRFSFRCRWSSSSGGLGTSPSSSRRWSPPASSFSSRSASFTATSRKSSRRVSRARRWRSSRRRAFRGRSRHP